MFVLFVHGMGRTPLSGALLLRRLRHAGMTTGSFGYVAALESGDAITARLAARIAEVAARGDYALIGHSLGGLLLRAALRALPTGVTMPKQLHLLGSPVQPSHLAAQLRRNWIFRALAGDCGQWLGSAERMAAVGAPTVPVMGIAGVRGAGPAGRFGGRAHDGIVSLEEVSAPWLAAQTQVPVMHTMLPGSRQVAEIIVRHLCALDVAPVPA